MGKSKDENVLKRSSPFSPRGGGGDEERTKRRKHKEYDDKKHKSSKKHKSHKSSKRQSDKDKKSGGKLKDRSHKKFKIQELSNDDYFSKNNEFAKWLKEEREVFFSDLSSESARNLFSEFVQEWNNEELEGQYYEGIATGPRTSHNWNIKQ